MRVGFLDTRGQPYAMLTSPMLTATVQARRQQLLAYHDGRGLEFAKAVVAGKLLNQERLLKYFGKYVKKTDPDRFGTLEAIVQGLNGHRDRVEKLEGTCIDAVRDTLMGIEGSAGRLYWDGVREIVSDRLEFFTREHRGATDGVNSMLNYGYGILYSLVGARCSMRGSSPLRDFSTSIVRESRLSCSTSSKSFASRSSIEP